LPDDFCNYREDRAHRANLRKPRTQSHFSCETAAPFGAASGETPVLAAGASKAPVHRPEDLESAYAARANRPARIPPDTSCRVQAAIGRLESDRSPNLHAKASFQPSARTVGLSASPRCLSSTGSHRSGADLAAEPMTVTACNNKRPRGMRAFYAVVPVSPLTRHTNADGGGHLTTSQ